MCGVGAVCPECRWWLGVAGGEGTRGHGGSMGVCEVLVGHRPAPEAEGRGWGRGCSVAAPHEGAGLGAEGAA